jgi:hypothetical protein
MRNDTQNHGSRRYLEQTVNDLENDVPIDESAIISESNVLHEERI